VRSPVARDDEREVLLQSGTRDTEPRKFWKQGIRRRAARTRYARCDAKSHDTSELPDWRISDVSE
jgi:hypothetical protein